MNDKAPSNERPRGSPFWEFSLSLYGKPGVPPACIGLQENAGVDVNVLLYCLFAARCGRAITASDASAILAAFEPWKAGAVVPLRAARVYLRDPAQVIDAQAAAALRQRIKAVELEAERLQQEGLFSTFPVAMLGAPCASQSEAARSNSASLQKVMGVDFDARALQTLLDAFDTSGGSSS